MSRAEIDPGKLFEFAALGLSQRQIAAVLKIPESTLRSQLSASPGLGHALAGGRAAWNAKTPDVVHMPVRATPAFYLCQRAKLTAADLARILASAGWRYPAESLEAWMVEGNHFLPGEATRKLVSEFQARGAVLDGETLTPGGLFDPAQGHKFANGNGNGRAPKNGNGTGHNTEPEGRPDPDRFSLMDPS